MRGAQIQNPSTSPPSSFSFSSSLRPSFLPRRLCLVLSLPSPLHIFKVTPGLVAKLFNSFIHFSLTKQSIYSFVTYFFISPLLFLALRASQTCIYPRSLF